ncbi:response regulator [Azospirillum doebereinerae]|uniref:Response regulator n=1 Tax=Azospirillum doebereinerae TaxID=92933 RepID=A0A3S0V177_9PROT|nr:response regulator [Azospirillum doebereinerae]RUQ70789.1 response regulator [Azospirillum doebereinerae]
MTKRPSSQIKILIVDDNPLLQRALKDMLGLWGVGQITAVSNGQDAKEALRREVFDLMVTDWVMEPVGGAQLIQWVRQSPGCLRPDLPIIVLTANADLSTVRCAWDSGADSVLAKPVPAATLARRIDAVLNRRDSGVKAGGQRAQDSAAGPQPARPGPQSGPQADATPKLPPPITPVLPAALTPRSTDPKRVRLLLALDRLDAAIERPDPIGSRLRHAVSDLQVAAAGDHAASSMVASLSTCVTWVEPDTEGFVDALQAHAAALRWAVGCDGGAQSMAVALCLIRTLRASVRTLAARGQSDFGGWPEAGPSAPSPNPTPNPTPKSPPKNLL